ncbi:MAG: class I SAM-dependent methyltransferase [Hyphomicrobiaceae bacterium]|nr:class I SAM-dependent methyltransferase [Hyphomicrobiaceae bacterium]
MTGKEPRDQKNARATQATGGMGGEGYYDDHSGPQRAGFREQQARVKTAVRHLDLTVPELRILDYGCGPGRTSITIIRAVLDELRHRNATCSVVAMHNDLAGNDWNGLFASVAGPEGYLEGYRKEGGHIRTEASIGSFFEPVASHGSVDLGLSFGASHWLSSQVRAVSPGSVFFCDLPEPARDEIAAVADRDWTTFLRHRAAELKPGGWLVVDGLGSVPDADDPSGRRAAGRRLYRALGEVAEDLAGEGRIDRRRLEEFVFPVYFRLSEEARGPLEREADLQDAFEIVEVANELLPMPTEEALVKTGDVTAYAESYTGFVRAFAESTLRKGLFDASATSAADAAALSDEFFNRLQARFAAEPKHYAFEHQVVTLVLRRR